LAEVAAAMCVEQVVAVQFHHNSSTRNSVAASDLIDGVAVGDCSLEVSTGQCRGVVEEDPDLGEPDSGSVHRCLAASEVNPSGEVPSEP
jgi:hypothetical protein